MASTRTELTAPGSAVFSRFPCFDGLRACAALAVFAFHSAGITYAEGAFTPPHWVLNWLSRLGFFGVSVFFVISGFLLYRPFALAALTDRPSPVWLPFWKRRFCRIFPAYWVALVVAVFFLGQRAFHSNQEYLFQFGLLQNYRGRYIEGGLGVAWTLVIEVSFYVTLPFIAALVAAPSARTTEPRARLRAQLVGLAAVFALSIAVRSWWLFDIGFRPHGYGAWFPIAKLGVWLPAYLDWFALGMAMGVGSAWLGLGGRVPRLVALLGHRPWLSWLLAVGCYWVTTQLRLGLFTDFTSFSPTQSLVNWTLTGLAAALFVLPAVFGDQGRTAIRTLLRHPIAAVLGLISYAIYLWHLTIWREVEHWFGRSWFPSGAIPQVAIVLALTVTVAALSYVWIERPIISWSTGRAAPNLREPLTRRPAPTESATRVPLAARGEPTAGRTPHLVVAATLVALAFGGLVLGQVDLRRAGAAANGLDPFVWVHARAAIWDEFARPDQGGLGVAATGQAWTPLTGSWAIRDGRATAAASREMSLSLIRVPAGTRVDLQATVAGSTELAGVAFRCQDAQNCFWVESVPFFGTWNVSKVVGGRVVPLGNVGPTVTKPGTKVAVHTHGSRITIAIDGTIVRTLSDPDLRDATGVGLTRAGGGTNEAHWQRFEASLGH